MIALGLTVRNWDVLMNAQSRHKWWSTIKSALFGSSRHACVCWWGGGVLLCEWVDRADLSHHFDIKQSRESVDLPITCHSSPSRITFAF